jgi:hypothetical protein
MKAGCAQRLSDNGAAYGLDLESQGRTPAEMSLKSRLRELMRRPEGTPVK